MKTLLAKTSVALLAVMAAGAAQADNDFGVGLKAGTLGLGLEGTWRPLPMIDVRVGFNSYDYDDTGDYSGIDYDGTLALDNMYATGSFHFPISPMRVTGGLYSNSNQVELVSLDSTTFDIGGQTYTGADVGTLRSTTEFDDVSPYLGIGFDFTLFDKVGLNLDLGVLWQGSPKVSVEADGLLAQDPGFLADLEVERAEIEDEIKDYKAWPVLSVGFVYNF